MSYYDWGPSNGQISKRPVETGLNPSGSITNMTGRSTCPITWSDLMRISHSRTPKLNILEIFIHFWPTSESCRQATTKDMDFIFPVHTLPTRPNRARNYEGMYMHSLTIVLGKIWWEFRWNLVLYGSKILFWLGSIKRPDLQTAYRNMAETFRVDFNVMGRSTCPITRSDLMRVSHSRTSKLNILEILIHFWPTSESSRQATTEDVDIIFHVRALPSLTYQACNYEGMVMHSLATVLCKIWWEFHWNLVIYGSKCSILIRVHQTARTPSGL